MYVYDIVIASCTVAMCDCYPLMVTIYCVALI